MEFFVSLIAIALMVIGATGIILLKKPMDKVIMFSIEILHRIAKRLQQVYNNYNKIKGEYFYE